MPHPLIDWPFRQLFLTREALRSPSCSIKFMIKWVFLNSAVKDRKDFGLLLKLLEDLGLRKGNVLENDNGCFQEFFPSIQKLEILYRKKPWDDADLTLTISDPDSAVEIVKKLGLKILKEHSGPADTHSVCNFRVQLPGGMKLLFIGFRAVESSDTDHIALEGDLIGKGKRFAIVVSRFNSFITERLLSGAIDGLVRCGVKRGSGYDIVRVPGAFEIPSAARSLAKTKKYDAIICIGCLLRGDTAHYDVIVNEVTRGIGQSAQETGVPHAFGVLTCDTLEQAVDRAGLKMGNKGFEAALAAIEMANLNEAIPAFHRPAKPGGKAVSAKTATKLRKRPK